MNVEFGPDSSGNQWAWTQGLNAYQQQDFAVPLAWEEVGGWRDIQIRRLLEFIASYVEGQPKRIRANETMRYGWTSLTFRPAGSNDAALAQDRLVVREIAEPLSDSEPKYVDGAERTIILHMHQGARAYQLGFEETDHPHRSMMATVCKRIRREGGSELFLWRRAAGQNQSDEAHRRDSRWLIGCTDREHAHNVPSEVIPVHLSHLVASYPYIFSYLALPDDTCIVCEGSRITVFRPGDPTPRLDTGERFTGLKDK